MTNYSTNSYQPASMPKSEVHLHDYVGVIMRRRWTFLAAFLLVFTGVAIYTFTVSPIYEATATLHVRDERGGKGDLLGELGVNRQNPIEAEIEILKSRSNAEQVVKRLQLDWKVTKSSRRVGFKIVDFASSEPGREFRVELTAGDGYRLLDADGKPMANGKSGALLQANGMRLLLTELKGKPGDSFRLSLVPLHAAANRLKSMVRAVEVGNKTSIIRLSYSDNDPALARNVVNTLVQVYLEQSVAFKTREASKSLEFIEEQMNGVRSELDMAEKNLQAYKTSTGVLKLDSEAEELVKKISETEKERTALALQRRQVDFSLSAMRDAAKRGLIYTPALLKDDAAVATLATKLSDLEVQKRALLAETTESHPQVRALQGQIDEIQKKMVATYETGQRNLSRQESTVAQNLGRYEGQLRQLPAAERDLARLMRHTKVNADIYTFLLQKHEEARIVKASTISNISVIDPVITPILPVKPNKPKNLLLGALIALMLGVGISFFEEYLDDTIKDAEGAKRLLGLSHLATIPLIGKGDGERHDSEVIVSHTDPRSPVAEAFRSLRTGIHFSAINQEKRVLVFTSSFPGEGKSTISTNLAITIAQTGVRVLLIDCDMRRSSLHTKLRIDKVPGLSEVLAGDVKFADAVRTTEIPNLSLLAAGTTPPNPSELLGSESMSSLLGRLRGEFDQIVIDAPPVLAVTDAAILTTLSDIVIVVLETGRIPAKAATRMRELLGAVQAPVAGLVVNDKTGRGMSYGYAYGYGYGYGYGYYAEDDATRKKSPWWKIISRR
jgi:tyrosine-protein kinase Etk/Wzc